MVDSSGGAASYRWTADDENCQGEAGADPCGTDR